MLTQDVTDELNRVFEQLAAQGKEPTLALVKARMSTSVPMPALIAAIKSWKSSNKVPKIEVAAETTTTVVERIEKLEQQINQLQQRIAALEAKQ
jgi:TolA-binding protein